MNEMASKADMEKRFGEQARYLSEQFASQNRFLYFAMAMQIAATLSLWLR